MPGEKSLSTLKVCAVVPGAWKEEGEPAKAWAHRFAERCFKAPKIATDYGRDEKRKDDSNGSPSHHRSRAEEPEKCAAVPREPMMFAPLGAVAPHERRQRAP